MVLIGLAELNISCEVRANKRPAGRHVMADLTGEPRTARGGHRSALVLLAHIGAVFPFGLLRLAKNLLFLVRRQGNAAEIQAFG